MNSKWIGLALVGCMFGVAAPSDADACGIVIPVDGETASVDAQRVTMAYFPEENRTRVMAQIGFVGDLSNFSWIIPLPSAPTAVDAVGEGARSSSTRSTRMANLRFRSWIGRAHSTTQMAAGALCRRPTFRSCSPVPPARSTTLS